MIKVAARRKFLRNTSAPFYLGQFNNKRSSQKNRSSIMNDNTSYQQFLELHEHTQTSKAFTNTKNNIMSQSLDNFNTNQPPQSNYRFGKSNSIKASQNFISPQNKPQFPIKKFNKIDSHNTSFIKIEQNDQKNSIQTIRMSQSTFKGSVRSSAIKKISKYEAPFSRNRNTRKASIFHQSHNLTVTHQSEQYEEFLKQSNLNQLTKKIICEKVSQNDEDKQNEEISERKSNFFTEEKMSQKPKKDKFPTQIEKEKNPKNLLRRISSKTKKSSQKALKLPKEDRRSYKQIFHSMTKTAIQEYCDKESQPQSQIQKRQPSSQTYNKQEMILRKQEQLKRAEQERIQREKIQKQQTKELFRRLQREIASKEEMERFQKKSNNYYEELRQKLMKKYERVWKDYRMDETERDNIGLLIDGCNLQRHRRVNNFYFEKKQSSGGGRIDAAAIGQATKDINKLNFINNDRNKTIMRPQTSRAKSNSKVKIKNSFQKSSNMLSDYIINTASVNDQSNIFKKINQTYNKLSQSDTECIFNLTNPDIKSRGNLRYSSTQRPKTAMSRDKNLRITESSAKQKQQVKQKTVLAHKFSALLDFCDEENYECDDTKRKMKVFEYYCGKIDNGFEKLAQNITNYVASM